MTTEITWRRGDDPKERGLYLVTLRGIDEPTLVCVGLYDPDEMLPWSIFAGPWTYCGRIIAWADLEYIELGTKEPLKLEFPVGS